MELKPISFMVLGMLRLGATSGYAIKSAADVSTRFIWPVSQAQVYPELARLEEHGMVTRREDPLGKRSRSSYALTEKGEGALDAWLGSSQEMPMQFRSEGLLRLFFADTLPIEEQITLVARLREHYRQDQKRIYDGDLGEELAKCKNMEIPYPMLVGVFGQSMSAHAERWLAGLEIQLKEKQADAGSSS
jgi:DNA-binding PadR family transcriptional regulator